MKFVCLKYFLLFSTGWHYCYALEGPEICVRNKLSSFAKVGDCGAWEPQFGAAYERGTHKQMCW